MRVPSLACLGIGCVLSIANAGCSRGGGEAQAPAARPQAAPPSVPAAGPVPGAVHSPVHDVYRGFDRNDYPGDDAMAALHRSFAFTGYWLTNPPGEDANTWAGKRSLLRAQGWGFVVLANGRLDGEILKAQRQGTAPTALGRSDAALALAAARREGFPPGTLLFLDQEEGGAMLDEQAAYLLAWTEAVAASGFRRRALRQRPAGAQRPAPDHHHHRRRSRTDRRRASASGDHVRLPGCLPARARLHAGAAAALCRRRAQPDAVAVCPVAAPPRHHPGPAPPPTRPTATATPPVFPALLLDLDAADSDDPSHGR